MKQITKQELAIMVRAREDEERRARMLRDHGMISPEVTETGFTEASRKAMLEKAETFKRLEERSPSKRWRIIEEDGRFGEGPAEFYVQAKQENVVSKEVRSLLGRLRRFMRDHGMMVGNYALNDQEYDELLTLLEDATVLANKHEIMETEAESSALELPPKRARKGSSHKNEFLEAVERI